MVTNEEIEIRRGDDTRGALSINSAPIRDGEGRIVAGVVTFFDITERKQVERKLREQAEMLDLAHDAIFAWEMDGAISYWNRAAEEIYGYAQERPSGASRTSCWRLRLSRTWTPSWIRSGSADGGRASCATAQRTDARS